MARKRRHSSPSDRAPPTIPDYPGSRDAYAIASAEPYPGPALTFQQSISPRSVRALWAFEDRRTFHPDPVRPYRTLTNRAARIGLLKAKGAKRPRKAPRSGLRLEPGLVPGREAVPYQVGFSGRSAALVCVRRHQRREVLFARGGPAGPPRPFRKPRWNQSSKLVCRRF